MWSDSVAGLEQFINSHLETRENPYDVIRVEYVTSKNGGLTIEQQLADLKNKILTDMIDL